MRHSIATHMIEQGIDVTFVKEFLGHESISAKHPLLKLLKK
ncbi:MAG: tyrosine-type recombinase/integrase [Bacteroidia bacterium]|nr:tyrosine-type recombinase/integrase [Bacteroidia bacterium]